jgi:hypothetical protein
MTTYATLELGDPADGLAWQKGCQGLGRVSVASIVNPSPTLTQLKAFFKTQPDWVYFSGHMSGTLFYGDGAELQFRKDRVAIATSALSVKYDPNALQLLKRNSDFTMQISCLLVILAGCSALESLWTVKVIRELFFNPTILGYAERCNVDINKAMMGAGDNTSHFFANIGAGSDLVNAWLQSGLSANPSRQSMFRAFDPDGQEWQLVDSKIVTGRSV